MEEPVSKPNTAECVVYALLQRQLLRRRSNANSLVKFLQAFAFKVCSDELMVYRNQHQTRYRNYPSACM
jgi:hypothetical protein